MSETTQIDLLFLELSQFTKAKTKREIELESEIERLKVIIDEWENNHLEHLSNKFKKAHLEGKDEQ